MKSDRLWMPCQKGCYLPVSMERTPTSYDKLPEWAKSRVGGFPAWCNYRIFEVVFHCSYCEKYVRATGIEVSGSGPTILYSIDSCPYCDGPYDATSFVDEIARVPSTPMFAPQAGAEDEEKGGREEFSAPSDYTIRKVGDRCKSCGKGLSLLTDVKRRLAVPAFFICFDCKRVSTVGLGIVPSSAMSIGEGNSTGYWLHLVTDNTCEVCGGIYSLLLPVDQSDPWSCFHICFKCERVVLLPEPGFGRRTVTESGKPMTPMLAPSKFNRGDLVVSRPIRKHRSYGVVIFTGEFKYTGKSSRHAGPGGLLGYDNVIWAKWTETIREALNWHRKIGPEHLFSRHSVNDAMSIMVDDYNVWWNWKNSLEIINSDRPKTPMLAPREDDIPMKGFPGKRLKFEELPEWARQQLVLTDHYCEGEDDYTSALNLEYEKQYRHRKCHNCYSTYLTETYQAYLPDKYGMDAKQGSVERDGGWSPKTKSMFNQCPACGSSDARQELLSVIFQRPGFDTKHEWPSETCPECGMPDWDKRTLENGDVVATCRACGLETIDCTARNYHSEDMKMEQRYSAEVGDVFYIKVAGSWTVGEWNGFCWAIPGRIVAPSEVEDVGPVVMLPFNKEEDVEMNAPEKKGIGQRMKDRMFGAPNDICFCGAPECKCASIMECKCGSGNPLVAIVEKGPLARLGSHLYGAIGISPRPTPTEFYQKEAWTTCLGTLEGIYRAKEKDISRMEFLENTTRRFAYYILVVFRGREGEWYAGPMFGKYGHSPNTAGIKEFDTKDEAEAFAESMKWKKKGDRGYTEVGAYVKQ